MKGAPVNRSLFLFAFERLSAISARFYDFSIPNSEYLIPISALEATNGMDNFGIENKQNILIINNLPLKGVDKHVHTLLL